MEIDNVTTADTACGFIISVVDMGYDEFHMNTSSTVGLYFPSSFQCLLPSKMPSKCVSYDNAIKQNESWFIEILSRCLLLCMCTCKCVRVTQQLSCGAIAPVQCSSTGAANSLWMLLTWTKSEGKADWQLLGTSRFVMMRHWKPEIVFFDNVVRSRDVTIMAEILYDISRSTFIHGFPALRLVCINILFYWQSHIEHCDLKSNTKNGSKKKKRLRARFKYAASTWPPVAPRWPKMCQDMHYLNT